jgi:hypothetical protein
VKSVGASVDKVLDKFGETGTRCPLGRESLDLLVSRDLAGEQEPEEAFWERLGAASSFGKELLALGDGLAAESDTLFGIENGA